MEFGCIDSESAVAVEIKHDDKLKEGDTVYFQVCYHSNHITISLQHANAWYRVLHNGCCKRYSTHNSPLNFDLTLAIVCLPKVGSMFRVESRVKWQS